MALTRKNLSDIALITATILIVLVLYGTISDLNLIALILLVSFAAFFVVCTCSH